MQRGTAQADDSREGAPRHRRLGALVACVFAATVVPAQAASALTVSADNINAAAGTPFSGAVGSFTDASLLTCAPDSNYSASVVWADHTTSIGLVDAGVSNGLNSCTYPVTAQHTFGTPGVESFHLAVASASASAGDDGTATVTGRPTVTATAVPASGAEAHSLGATVATFTSGDPHATAGEFAATVDWGDGTAASAGVITIDPSGSFGVFASHTYANPGAYSATVTITDGGATAATVQVPVTIADASLSATGTQIAATEGAAFSGVVATLTDQDVSRAPGYYTGTIAWGDGQSSSASFAANGAGSFPVSGSHTYADHGTYPVTTTISDPGGQTASATTSAAVAGAALSSTAVGVSATEGAAFTATVAAFHDADTSRPPSHYSASVDWGDGSPASVGTITADGGGSFHVTAGHAYASPGTYLFTVTITEPGDQTAASGSAGVADAPLTATGGAPLHIVLGTPVQGTVATFTDADPGGTPAGYSATIDWGDGSSSPGTVVADPDGGFAVSGAHAYGATGTFTLAIAITDNNGGSTAYATDSVDVAAPPPPPPPPPPTPATTVPPAVTTPATPTPKVATVTPEAPPILSVSSPRLQGTTAFVLRVTCPQSASHCRGVARVITLAPRARTSPLRGGTTLGSTVFVLSSGESRTLKIAVPKRLRTVLRKARSARLAGVAIAYGANGRSHATTGPTAVISTTRVR